MRKLSQLPIEKQVDSDFPNGAIINETDTQDGTPVVRELYNDPLVNLYAVMDAAGIAADGTEDNASKYQLLEAFRKLPNLLNDIEQVLTLSGGVWSVPVNLTPLPNKYFFIARAADAYTPGTFKGSGASPVYAFTSPGFNASDEVLIIVDTAGVRAYSISGIFGNVANELFTLMGTPIQYNDQPKLYYQEAGNILSDTPTVDYIEEIIRSDVADNSVLVTDMFIMQGYLLCVVYFPTEITYKFRQFAMGDFTVSYPVTVSGAPITVGTDYSPYFYADALRLYVTQKFNFNVNDNDITTLTYSGSLATLTLYSNVTLDASFVKTTNAAVKSQSLYTMVAGVLSKFDLSTGTKTALGNYTGVAGQLFNYKDNIYFTSGEVAKLWF